MLWTIAVVLLVLWLLGMAALPSVGSLDHLLLVLAVVVVLVNVIQGRRSGIEQRSPVSGFQKSLEARADGR